MDRRKLLSSAATVTVFALAGCSGDSSNSPDDDTSGETTPETALTHLETVYEAWVQLDADAFLATLHSTNNHPESEVRSSADRIGFEGELVALNAEVLNENLGEDEISTFFETGPNVGEEDVSTFTGVQNLTARVEPEVDGETTNETQENIKAFFETGKRHFLAVEDGQWRFVL